MPTGPIFVRSSRGYSSYTDFWNLVEWSNFPIIKPSEVDFSKDVIYIWVEMDVDFMIPTSDTPKGQRRARTVFWHIEPVDRRASDTMDAQAWWKAGLDQTLELVDDVWVSDRGIMELDPRPTWATFGGHFGLRKVAIESGPTYDVAHLGQRTPRRQAVIDDLEKRGITVSPSPWGAQRILILTMAKVMLDVQRLEGMPMATPIRWVTAAAYQLPIVREELPDPDPLVDGRTIILAPYDQIADRVEAALKLDLSEMGAKLWRKMCQDDPFDKGVQRAVKASKNLALASLVK